MIWSVHSLSTLKELKLNTCSYINIVLKKKFQDGLYRNILTVHSK